MSFFSLLIVFFSVLNPLGNIPLFNALLGKYNLKERTLILIREFSIALVILSIFTIFGEHFLRALGLSSEAIMISGGLILLIISINLIFGFKKELFDDQVTPFIVPIALPLIAGPGAMSSLMIYSHQFNKLSVFIALFVAWLASLFIVMLASYLYNFLSRSIIESLKSFSGLLLIILGTQMIINGIKLL